MRAACRAASGGSCAERAHRLSQPPELAPRQRLQRLICRLQRRRLRLGVQALDQGDEARLAERLQERRPVGRVLGLERAQEAQERALIGGAEQVGIRPQVIDQHVEIAHRAERAAEPAQLGPQRPHPVRVEQRPGGAQDRPHPPGRHPHLVQLLGIGAEPGAGVVADDRLVLRAQRGGHVLAGRGRPARGRGRRRDLEVERLEQLRPGVGVGRPGLPQPADDGAQVGARAVDQLDLDLLEPARDPAPLEHRHRVRDDLGDLAVAGADQHPGTVRLQTRHRHGPGAAQVGGEQAEHLRRSRPRDALELQLEPILAVGQLQLPGAVAALGAVAQRDPARGQPQVGCVVIGRTELPHRQTVARQGRERETGGGGEFALPLECGLHPRDRTIGATVCRRASGRRSGRVWARWIAATSSSRSCRLNVVGSDVVGVSEKCGVPAMWRPS